MLEAERASFVGVALETDLILRRRRPQLGGKEAAMLVVTVGALHQSLIDAMAERPRKIPFDFGVAAITEFRLLLDQEILFRLGVVGRVAGHATHAVDIVLRAVEVGMLLAILVTRHAAFAGLLRGRAGEGEDLALVAAALDVFLARSVTGLAAHGRTALERRLPVRRSFECLVDGFVAGLTRLGADILRSVGSGLRRLAFGCFFAGGQALRAQQHCRDDGQPGRECKSLKPFHVHCSLPLSSGAVFATREDGVIIGSGERKAL